MMLDTSTWGEYKLGGKEGLFTIKKGKRLTKEDMSEGLVNFIGAISVNNGVRQLIDVEPRHAGNCITVNYNGSVGEAFYQTEPFWASDDVNVLYAKGWELTDYVAMFIVTIIKANRYKFGYGCKWTLAKMKASIIKLPKAKNGKPDFNYMESYIKTITTSLQPPNTDNDDMSVPVLKISDWEEFTIGDLFSPISCKCNVAGDLIDGDDCFYIGAKKNDNGLMKRVKKDEDLMTLGNCIVFICDGQGSVGYSNYMDEDFIGSATLSAGYNDNLNKYTGAFLVSVLDLERKRYSFGRKYRPTLNETSIRLPAFQKNDGTFVPDWDYMENYIKALPYGDVI